MRLKSEIQAALSKCIKADNSGAYSALEWVLGKDDERFGPVKVKRAKRVGVGRPTANISDARLLSLRERGWSLQKLAKEFGCAKATVVLHLKRARLQEIADIDTFADIDD